jgi:hypothetical protein
MSQFQEKKKRYDKINELQTLKNNLDLEEMDKTVLQRQLKSLKDPLYQSKQKLKERMISEKKKQKANLEDKSFFDFLSFPWSESSQTTGRSSQVEDDYTTKAKANMKNVFNEMDTLRNTNKSNMIIDKLNSLNKNKNQLVESRQLFSNKLDKLESKSNNTKLNEKLRVLKQQTQRQYLKLNELADIELNIRDVRKTNQQKQKYLQQYERKIMNQQNRYKQFQNEFQKMSIINELQQRKRTTIVRNSLYVAYVCLILMTILTILTLTSENRRSYLSGFTYVIDKVLFCISFVALSSYLYHINIKTHMMELNVITIIYTLMIIVMISIHQKKNRKIFTEEDKKKFTIALSIKLGLISFLLAYLLVTSKVYKDYNPGSLILQVKSKVRTQLTTSLSMMITTVIGIVAANTLQYLK